VTPERWQRMKQLFEAALEQEPTSREKFLARAAADDPTLADEVMRLLASDREAGAFLSAPPDLSSDALGPRDEPTARRESDAAPPLVLPSLSNRYRIESEIGHGSMGRVFCARDLKLEREVAIKVLPAGARTADQLSRFEQEARAAGSLDHPNVVVVHDIGMVDGEPFIVTELLQGATLRERLRGKALPSAEAAEYALQLVQGLRAAHAKGIVHRDLKPENLFLTREGRLKILDFGIAKLSEAPVRAASRTSEGALIGTVDYMSPEQVRGEPADARSDIFACGSILYEMLAGHRAFERGSVVEAAYAILNEEPAPLPREVPVGLARIVERCLAKRPEDRVQSAADLTAVLMTAPPSAARLRPQWRLLVIAGAAALAIFVMARRTRTNMERRSIAVIPFANLNGDKENEYLSDGITEELIDALANIDGMHVASRTSVFSLKYKDLDAPRFGARLGVRMLVEGSVRREGNLLRVTAQLIDVERDEHLWSGTYDRDLKGILALENEIAYSIATALRRKLLDAPATSTMRGSTTDLEAHDLYLRGRYFKEKRSAESLRVAIRYFEQALERDAQYALAWVGLADATAIQLDHGAAPALGILAKAAAAVQHALDIDPDLPEAHATLAAICFYRYDWTGAERELTRSMELKPDYPTAHHWYSLVLAYSGRLAEARVEADRALQLDPTSLIINHNVGLIRHFDRDFQGAVAAYKKTLELEPAFRPTHTMLGWTYAALGRYAEAHAEYDLGPPVWSDWARGFTYAMAGQRSAALQVLKKLEADAEKEYQSPTTRGYIYLALGAFAPGYELLRQACAGNDFYLRQASIDPMLDSLRKDPRFHEILKCAHLE